MDFQDRFWCFRALGFDYMDSNFLTKGDNKNVNWGIYAK